MAIFPNWWDYLIPNLNIFTVIGILAIVFAIVCIKAMAWIKMTTGMSFKLLKKTALISFLSGIVLIWGVSAIQKFLTSTGGAIIFWGAVIVIVIGVLLFWNPKEKKPENV